MNNGSKNHIAKVATQVLQDMELIIWTETLAFPGKYENATLGIGKKQSIFLMTKKIL